MYAISEIKCDKICKLIGIFAYFHVALRILCICFEQRLGQEWPRIVRVMRDLGRRNEAAPELWSFLEFVVTHRTPLYICLMPFILHKVCLYFRTAFGQQTTQSIRSDFSHSLFLMHR